MARVARYLSIGSRTVVAAIVLMSLIACTPTKTTVKPPFAIRGMELPLNELQQLASASCTKNGAMAETLPPHPFTTDGCSLWPDAAWRDCCVEHDVAYWCGGTYVQRLQADKELRACVTKQSNSFNAWLMFLGVRVGGGAYMPSPWRWGYGYDYPFSASKRPKNGGRPRNSAN